MELLSALFAGLPDSREIYVEISGPRGIVPRGTVTELSGAYGLSRRLGSRLQITGEPLHNLKIRREGETQERLLGEAMPRLAVRRNTAGQTLRLDPKTAARLLVLEEFSRALIQIVAREHDCAAEAIRVRIERRRRALLLSNAV